MGRLEYAQYPFLEDAGRHVTDSGFSIEQFGNDLDLLPYVERAMERITIASNGKVYSSELDKGGIDHTQLDREVYSFVIAVIILKICGKNSLITRFALAESRRAERFLEKDLGRGSSGGSTTAKILADLFSVDVKRTPRGYAIPVHDYVSHSVRFHEREWKLVNRVASDGMVLLNAHHAVRLLRSELGNYIRDRISRVKTPPMMPNFEDPVAKLNEIAKDLEPEYVIVSGEHPPCIKHALDVLKRGENLPHSGRFMLATFLFGRGWTIEKIAPIFKNAPDYNERTTTYQLKNISGVDGATRYNCPLCDKLRAQDLCHETSECAGIITPMQFGTRRK